MSKIVLASSNPGKIAELQEMLKALSITVLPQTTFGITDIEEIGLTFVENAILKARHASQATGLPAIADDSGLEVNILHGEPGIYSARYAGKTANSSDNIEKLLQKLATTPDDKRTARFLCVLVYLRYANDPSPIICQGVWEGSILKAPQGSLGFGYDPIFYVPTHHCSAAQLPLAEKNRLSHRAQAMHKMVKALRSLMNSD